MVRALSFVKNCFISPQTKVRRVPIGLLKGLRFEMQLQSQMQIYVGLNELELAPWFRKLSKNAKCIIDVGADVGFYTLYFLGKTNATKVLAFEPAPHSHRALEKNLALNRFRNSPRLRLSTDFVSSESGPGKTHLDGILNEVEYPCLVKMDIEGHELEALQGSHQLLRKNGVSWILETHSEKLHKECWALFASYGYKVTEVNRPWWRMLIPELRPADFNGWLIATAT